MICRHWRGTTRKDAADAYVRHLEANVLPVLAGHGASATVLRRDVAAGVEFLVLSYWPSRDVMEAFAGPDAARAVVEPEAQALMVDWDETVTLYEVVQGG